MADPAPGTVAGLVLAAGAGRRYGGPKALVRIDGRLLVERAVAVAEAGGCDPVLVVLGAAADQIRGTADLDAATVLDNPDWPTGMGSSLRAGLAALAGTTAVAAIVLLVDTPALTATAVRRLLPLAGPDILAMAGYADHNGHPVLLGRAHWPGVAALAEGDVGARPYLRAHPHSVRVVDCADLPDDTDLDVPPPRPPR